MGLKFLAQGNNSSRYSQPGINPDTKLGTSWLLGWCPEDWATAAECFIKTPRLLCTITAISWPPMWIYNCFYPNLFPQAAPLLSLANFVWILLTDPIWCLDLMCFCISITSSSTMIMMSHSAMLPSCVLVVHQILAMVHLWSLQVDCKNVPVFFLAIK